MLRDKHVEIPHVASNHQSEEIRKATLNINPLKSSRPRFHPHSLWLSGCSLGKVPASCLWETAPVTYPKKCGSCRVVALGSRKIWQVSGLEKVGIRLLPGCPTLGPLRQSGSGSVKGVRVLGEFPGVAGQEATAVGRWGVRWRKFQKVPGRS